MSIPGKTVRYELQGQYVCNGDKRWTTLSTHISDDHALKAAKAVDRPFGIYSPTHSDDHHRKA